MDFLDRVADSWTSKAVAGQYIKEEDQALYRYGFRLGISTLVIDAVTFACSFVLGTPIPTLLYLLFFSPLRSYAGGIHAPSRKMCFCVSVGMYLLVNGISRIPIVTVPVGLACAMLAAVVIWVLAPVEDPNKPLSDSEIVHYRRFSRIVLLLEAIAIGVMVWVSVSRITILFGCLSIVSVAVLVVLGRIRNHRTAVANRP